MCTKRDLTKKQAFIFEKSMDKEEHKNGTKR